MHSSPCCSLYFQEKFPVWRNIRRQTTNCLLRIFERRKQLARYGTIALNGGNCVIKYEFFLPRLFIIAISFIYTVAFTLYEIRLPWLPSPDTVENILQLVCLPITICAIIYVKLFSYEYSAMKNIFIISSLVLWVVIASTTGDISLACIFIAVYLTVTELFPALSDTKNRFTIKRFLLWVLIALSTDTMDLISMAVVIFIIVAELFSYVFPVKIARFPVTQNTIKAMMSWALVTFTVLTGNMFLGVMIVAVCFVSAELLSDLFFVAKERFVMQKDIRASHHMLDILKGLGVTSKHLNLWALHHPDTVSHRTLRVTNEALDRCGVFYTIRNIGGYSDDVTQPTLFEKCLYQDDFFVKTVLLGVKLFGYKWVGNKSTFDVHQRMALLSREMGALGYVHARCEELLTQS